MRKITARLLVVGAATLICGLLSGQGQSEAALDAYVPRAEPLLWVPLAHAVSADQLLSVSGSDLAAIRAVRYEQPGLVGERYFRSGDDPAKELRALRKRVRDTYHVPLVVRSLALDTVLVSSTQVSLLNRFNELAAGRDPAWPGMSLELAPPATNLAPRTVDGVPEYSPPWAPHTMISHAFVDLSDTSEVVVYQSYDWFLTRNNATAPDKSAHSPTLVPADWGPRTRLQFV